MDIHRYTLLIALLLTVVALWSWLTSIARTKRKATTSTQRQLERLITEIPGAVFQYQRTKDNKSSLPYLSPGIQRFCGIDPDKVQGDTQLIIDCIHPKDRHNTLHSLKSATFQQEPWKLEFRIVNAATEQIHWVAVHAKPELKPNGDILYHGYLHDITQEREVHQTLQSQELKLSLALDAVQEGIWEYDHQHGFLEWDVRLRTMLGYGKKYSRLNRKQIAALVHSQDFDTILLKTEKSLIQKHTQNFDFSLRIRTASNEWVWVQIRGRVIEWDDQNQPVRSMGLMGNISSQIADLQLRDALLNRSVACITLVSKDRQLIEANARFKAVFLPPNSPIEKFDFRSQIHIDDEHWREFGKKYEILRRQDQVRFEFPMKDQWGTVHWFDMHGVLKEPGNPESDVIWTWFDVSARRAADQALSIERLRLHTLLQHFPGGVLIVDSQNAIVFLNNQAAQLLSISINIEEIEGSDYTKLPELADLQTYEWLERSKSLQQGERDKRFEVQTHHGQHLEIEYLDIRGTEHSLGAVWFIRDVTQRIQEAQWLRELADTDSLTGLPNRRCFLRELNHRFQDAEETSHHEPAKNGILLMLDIDHFKKLNDSHGHITGDRVLVHIAQIIRQSLRPQDLPARLGGEEFAILLPDTDPVTGMNIAESIRRRIENYAICFEEKQLPITTSIGLCQIDTNSIEDAISRADQALYVAKAQGRNQTIAWQPTWQPETTV